MIDRDQDLDRRVVEPAQDLAATRPTTTPMSDPADRRDDERPERLGQDERAG